MMATVGIDEVTGLTKEQTKRICNTWVGIGWSTKDTDETIIAVKVNNQTRKVFCNEK